ncbi:MAG: HypC/HybG/HupF family hydrogenase formation chaperone [Planctomycetes bacterium]|nr:HypC/HybG/HupF family hydrogenase formation chaperone [Planctomycetota bacterium]
MCVAVPGKIVSIDQPAESGQAVAATVDFQGTRMSVCLSLTPEAEEGSWVLVHAGFAIQTITEEDALETWKYLSLAEDSEASPPTSDPGQTLSAE